MPLQPFVGPLSLLQFCNLFYTDGRTPWTSDEPVVRPLSKHRITQTQNKHIHRYPWLEWDSNLRPSVRASEDSSCLEPRGLCHRIKRLTFSLNSWQLGSSSELHFVFTVANMFNLAVDHLLSFNTYLKGNRLWEWDVDGTNSRLRPRHSSSG
jgi:hypothetical protein